MSTIFLRQTEVFSIFKCPTFHTKRVLKKYIKNLINISAAIKLFYMLKVLNETQLLNYKHSNFYYADCVYETDT